MLDPASKLSTHRWAETIWWDDGAVVELQHYYRSLGILARSIKKIEEHLYYREREANLASNIPRRILREV